MSETIEKPDTEAVALDRLVRSPRWIGGERVTREIYMDDGTWQRLGDKCLKNSPLRHGTVVKRSKRRPDEILVRWDDGEEKAYLDHGVNAEIKSNVSRE